MASDFEFVINFVSDTSGLRRLRQVVERELSKLKIPINPQVRQAAGGTGSPGAITAARGAVESEIAKATKKLVAARDTLANSQKREAELSGKLAALTASNLARTNEQAAELKAVKRSLGAQRGATTRAQTRIEEYTKVLELLTVSLQAAGINVEALTSGFSETKDIVRSAASKINALRGSTDKQINEQDDLVNAITKQTLFRRQQVRVIEDAVRAEGGLAQELAAQARQIVDAGLAAGTLTDAQDKLAADLFAQAARLGDVGRPLEAIRGSATELSVRFGAAGKTLQEALGVTRQEIIAAANKFEGDIGKIVQQFLPGTGADVLEERARIIEQVNAAAKREIQSENEVIAANKAFAAKQESLARDRSGQSSEAEKTVVDAFRKIAQEALERGEFFSDTLQRASTQFGGTLDSVRKTIEQVFVSGAKESVQQLVRQFSTSDKKLIDTKKIQQELDDQASFLQQAFGVTATEARKLLDPLKNKLENIQLKEIERVSVEGAKNFAQVLASTGVKFIDVVDSAESRFGKFGPEIDAFRKEFAKSKNTFVREVRETAKAIGRFDVDEFEKELQDGFGVAAGEARLIGADIKQQVRRANVEKAAKNLANEFLTSGKTFSEAVFEFENRFNSLSTGSLNAVRNAFEKGAAAFLKSQLDKAKDISQLIDVVDIKKQLTKRFGLGTGDATVAIQKFEKDLLDVREKAASDAVREAQLQADISREITNLREQQRREEQRILDAIKEAVDTANKERKLTTERKSGGSGGGLTSPQNLARITQFAEKLDTKSLARFVSLLKQEEGAFKKANAALKSHQGNIAKSNSLVDNLTSSLNSGEKAAFQFGFAAASAAERLVAWASPAALIFTATNLLREAVDEIIRLDNAAAKLAFFQPQVLNDIASNINTVTEVTLDLAPAAEEVSNAFDRLSNIQEKQQAISRASSRLQKVIIDRAQETGVSIETLTAILTTSGRVGQEAFVKITDGANRSSLAVSSFAKSIELLTRLEGGTLNTEQAVANLNSAISIFGEESKRAEVLVARLGQSAGAAGLSADELLQAVVRAGPAFRELGVASFTEALELAAAATQKVIPSASQLGTLLKRLNTNAAQAAAKIQEFSGVDIIGDDGVIDLKELLLGLAEVDKLGGTAKSSLIAAFSDKKIQAGFLGLSQIAGKFAERIDEIRDPLKRQVADQEALSKALAFSNIQSQTFESELNKLRATLAETVKATDVLSIGKVFVQGANVAADFVNEVGESSKGVISLQTGFVALGAAALPTLAKITEGFRAGFLQNQISLQSIESINENLNKEGGLIKGVVEAEKEGLITTKSVQKARELVTKELIKVPEIERRIRDRVREISILEKDRVNNQAKINVLKGEQNQDEKELIALLDKERKLQAEIRREVEQRATGFSKLGKLVKPAAFAALGFVAQAASTAIINNIDNPQNKKLVESGLQGLISGAGAGFLTGGPIGAGIGALIGGAGGLGIAFLDSRNEAEKLAKQQAEIVAQGQRSLEITQKEAEFREEQASKVNAARAEAERISAEILAIDQKIREVGAERAEAEGLLVRRQEKTIELRRANLSAAKQEVENAKKLEESQKRLLQITQQKLIIEKELDIVRNAQLGILRAQGGNVELETRLNLRFDELSIRNAERELNEQLTELTIRVTDTDLTEAQRLQAEKQIEQIRNQLVAKELDVIRLRQKAQEDLLKAAEDSARKQIDAWKSASDSVTSAFSDIIAAQSQIADLIREEASIVDAIFGDQLRSAQNVLRLSSSQLLGDNILQQLPESIRLSVLSALTQFPGAQGENQEARNNFLERQFAAAERQRADTTLQRVVRSQAANVDTPGRVLTRANELASAISSANIGIKKFTDDLSLSERKLINQLETEGSSIEANIDARLNFIESEKTSIDRSIQARENEISAIDKTISSLLKRADAEVDFVNQVLDDPAKILEDQAKQFFTQEFLRRSGFANLGPASIDALVKAVENNIGNRGAIQQILGGAQAAAQQGVQLIQGVDPNLLVQILAKAINPQSDASDINEFIKKQVDAIKEQERLRDEIRKLRERQLQLLADSNAIAVARETIAKARFAIATKHRDALLRSVDAQVSKTEQLRVDFIDGQNILIAQEAQLIELLGGEDGLPGVRDAVFDAKEAIETMQGILNDAFGTGPDSEPTPSPDAAESKEEAAVRTRIESESAALLKKLVGEGAESRIAMAKLVSILEDPGTAARFTNEDLVKALQEDLNARKKAAEEGRVLPDIEVKAPQEVLDAIRNSISAAFAEATQEFNASVKESLKDPLKVDVGDLQVQLNARLDQNITGLEFFDQLVNDLLDAGASGALIGQVKRLQEAVAALVDVETQRGTVLPQGADSIGGANR